MHCSASWAPMCWSPPACPACCWKQGLSALAAVWHLHLSAAPHADFMRWTPARIIPPDLNPASHQGYPSEFKFPLDLNLQGLGTYNFPVSPGTGWCGPRGVRSWESVVRPKYPQLAWFWVLRPPAVSSRTQQNSLVLMLPGPAKAFFFHLYLQSPSPLLLGGH